MTEDRLPPIHPGEILLEEFLKPMDISQYRLARDISVPARRINEICVARVGCRHYAWSLEAYEQLEAFVAAVSKFLG